jgi:hypothetical protein
MTLLIPTTKRDARKRWDAGLSIGVTQDRYPMGLDGCAITRNDYPWSFDELAGRSVDSRRPSCVFWFRTTD